jgi:hypothetical protein
MNFQKGFYFLRFYEFISIYNYNYNYNYIKLYYRLMLSSVIIVVVLLIIYTYAINADDHLEGYWVADDNEFTDNAGIESMMVYVGEKTGRFPRISRECYIVISPDVANDMFTMKYWKSWNLSPNKYEITPTLEFDNDDAQIPTDASWIVDISRGTLTITKDKKIYAKLYKQHELSNL